MTIRASHTIFATLLLLSGLSPIVPRSAAQTTREARPAFSELKGRPVQAVRLTGNSTVSPSAILNLVRTGQGQAFDPQTVEEDYQRIFGLRKFSNVEARVEPTEGGGVIVTFDLTEQRQIQSIEIRGNAHISADDILKTIEIVPGEAIDAFRINIARDAIQDLYHEKNFAFAHVTVPEQPLDDKGTLVFQITEGPRLKIRNIKFIGNKSYTAGRLRGAIQTAPWFPIFKAGKFDPVTVEDDVAALQRFYLDKGFFDVRVGRELVFSPELNEMQVNFIIDEGPRYKVDSVKFQFENDKRSIEEAKLRENLKLTPGRFYDQDLARRDVREMIRAYSPYGFIYQPASNDPKYLRIEPKPVFRKEAGAVDLVYVIREGEPFRIGRILVKGNSKTQDKVAIRELRVAPGDVYNSGAVQDAIDRLRARPYFSRVSVTPIGDAPDTRDLLVEVEEAKTAKFTIGAGVNSNGGVGGNITYEEQNFDLGAWPTGTSDLWRGHAFVGGGQNFRLSFEPGTEQTNATLRFTEPFLFDQPYSFSTELYLRDRQREFYDDRRLGGRLSFGKRFDYTYSAAVSFRGEEIFINDISDPEERAPEILLAEGHSALTSVGLTGSRDTLEGGLLPNRGSRTTAGVEFFGALGGDYDFQKLSVEWTNFFTVHEDLLDRRTVLNLRADVAYIFGDAPFFERLYGGGIGSVRGFRFRGISPRSGLDDDPIGGNFMINGTAELNFPIAEESLRGVVFVDAGTVEEEFEANTIRTSIGAGMRLTLPFLGQTPIAIDFGYPLNKDEDEDRVQYISFSLGIVN